LTTPETEPSTHFRAQDRELSGDPYRGKLLLSSDPRRGDEAATVTGELRLAPHEGVVLAAQ